MIIYIDFDTSAMEATITNLEQWAQTFLSFTNEDTKILSVFLIGQDMKFTSLTGFFYFFIDDITISRTTCEDDA